MLLRMGCEWGQGYAIGHPMPAHEFEQWLHTWQVPLSWKGFKPDSRSALPVPFTYADHRVWISQMIDYLSGKTQVPPQPEALQYWRDQSGRPTFFGKDPDDQVDVLHQSIQQLAHTLSEMKNAGRVEALRAGIDKLQHLQADLLGIAAARPEARLMPCMGQRVDVQEADYLIGGATGAQDIMRWVASQLPRQSRSNT